MKLLRLLALSVLILLIAWVFQPPLEGSQGPDNAGLAGSPLGVGEGRGARSEWRVARGEEGGARGEGQVSLSLSSPLPLPTRASGSDPTPTPAQPQVVGYEPTRNALLDDLHAPLVVTFDRRPPSAGSPPLATDGGRLTADYQLQITPSVQGRVTWRDDRTLVFVPEQGWAPGTRYEVRLGEAWHTWFRTARLVQGFWPGQGDGVSPRTNVAVQFGLPVDRASVERAFTIAPAVPGRLRWTDERRMVFEPDQPLDYVTTYRVSFDAEIRDPTGAPLPVVAGWSFTTRSALISAKPAGGASVENPIQLKFDAPVDRESVEAALVITPTVAGSLDWQGNALIFTPNDFLEPETTYYVTLGAAARDAAGGPLLTSAHHWHFWTNSVPRTVEFGYGPNIQLLDADGRRAVQLTSYASQRVTLRLYALDVTQFLDRYTSSFRGIGPDEDKPIETGDLPLALAWEQEPGKPGEVLIPATASPGLYVLEAQSGPGRDQLIVVLTRHALVLKQAERQLVTWASTLADHAPAAGMHLRFYDRDGALVAEGATEGRGLHRTVVPVDTEPLIVVGELEGDITVSGLGQEWQVGPSWWGWWKTSPSAPDATIYPYTDRPIYRPGQTVHARAVVRRDDDAVYSLPDGVEVVLRLRDARDNVIATRRRTPDEFGAAYADFEIADGGTVGTYHLEVSALGESVRQPFLVEAYRKPDYEVTLTPAQGHVVAGDPLTLTVQASYFFGPPVANARVELMPYVVGYDEWYAADPALDYGYAHEQLRRTGQTDAAGRYTVALPAGVTNAQDQQTWNVEATVTDASGLSVSGHARVVVHRAAFGLSLSTGRHHYRPGEPIPVTLLARDHRASAQAGARLTVGLYAWDVKTDAYQRAVVEREATTDASGRAEATLQTTRSGWYQLRATGSDGAGREMQTWDWVLVYDAGSGLWEAGQGGELRLSTDRERYAPGDAVSLLIESPVSGPALLSFERGTTRRETVIQLEEGLNALEFELLPDDVPNVHVAVAAWRPAPDDERWRYQSRPEQELLTARTEILVPADDKRLTVTVTPDRSQYVPRDEAVFLVEMRDQAGQPVRAGFSLALVDEAIFALAADETPDIFHAFYQARPDLVRTYHSLRPTRWLNDWGMGGGGGGDAPGGSPRSDFPDTAFWAPALATDADGRALVRVPLPDSLTSWRAVVRAVTADTKVGQATANVTVALPLSIQPVLPRFLVQGDRATLTAVVHNHTGERQVASVRLSATGLTLGEALSATQQVTLPADGTVAVGWPVVASELGQASVRVDVALQGGPGEGGEPWHDAVVLPLPVVPLAIPQVTTVASEVEGEWVETITLPDAAIPDVSRWELSLAPSIATGMLDGLEFLIDYPFG